MYSYVLTNDSLSVSCVSRIFFLSLSLSLSVRATCHDDSVEYSSSFLLSPSPLAILAHTQSPTSPCKIDRRQPRGANSADGATVGILSFWHTRARARCREEQKREKCCARKMRRSSNALYCEAARGELKKKNLHGVIVVALCGRDRYLDR